MDGAMIRLMGLGILVSKTLVIGDLHIGYEEAMNKQGVLVPRVHFAMLRRALEELIEKTTPDTVIIAGDIKHEFGAVSEQEWRETLKIIDLITAKAKLILVKGNHDTILGPIAGKRIVEIKEHYLIKSVYICHGDKIPRDDDFKKAKTVIIGHEHPAITLRDGIKQETYKCFLKAEYGGKKLFVLPSFNFVSEGADITKKEFLSPFLKNASAIVPVVVHEGKEYSFGNSLKTEQSINF
jgi:putative SbcD/Mre11-related phosphoesterase